MGSNTETYTGVYVVICKQQTSVSTPRIEKYLKDMSLKKKEHFWILTGLKPALLSDCMFPKPPC